MGETLEKRGVIFAGGEILDYQAIANDINESDYIVCADSGYAHCETLGIQPDLLVGDMDSIKEIPAHVKIQRLSVAKNYTDTMMAIRAAIEKGCGKIVLCGMLGGRFDHSFANIQALVYCVNRGKDCFVTDGHTQVYCVKTENELTSFKLKPKENCYFSLLAYSPICRKVNIYNGLYPLVDYDLGNDDGRAVSNEFVGKEVEITFVDGTLLVMTVPK